MRGEDHVPEFIPGLRLSELFYHDAVKPILDRFFPTLRYAAGLLGAGSDVLGFDTIRSTDHDWGPRLFLFLPPDAPVAAPQIVEQLRQSLPPEICGYSTNFGAPGPDGARMMEPVSAGPIEHRVTVTTFDRFLLERLGVASVDRLDPVDWLLFSDQALLEVTAGGLFHDGIGVVSTARETLSYYPHDVWLYLLAAQWMRISQQEPFVGRTGEVGDDPGSAVIAAELVRDVMQLAFLLERRYAPYSKWFGTAFARLQIAPRLLPALNAVLAGRNWREREAALGRAYEIVATRQNDLGITKPLPATVSPFHNRPFLVIHGERFAEALLGAISDERVRRLPPSVGGVDQFVNSTDVLSRSQRRRTLRALLEA